MAGFSSGPFQANRNSVRRKITLWSKGRAEPRVRWDRRGILPHPNREFFVALQGIVSGDHGIFGRIREAGSGKRVPRYGSVPSITILISRLARRSRTGTDRISV